MLKNVNSDGPGTFVPKPRRAPFTRRQNGSGTGETTKTRRWPGRGAQYARCRSDAEAFVAAAFRAVTALASLAAAGLRDRSLGGTICCWSAHLSNRRKHLILAHQSPILGAQTPIGLRAVRARSGF